MSARLEDLKFLFTLSAVVLFGSGLDITIPAEHLSRCTVFRSPET